MVASLPTTCQQNVKESEYEMSKAEGKKAWLIPDGFWPTISNGVYPSHEAVSVLNTGDVDAEIDITLYFEDRDKMEGFRALCGAERTHHIRMDKLKDLEGRSVPQGVPYAMLVRSSVDVIVQYSRMDTTQAEMALMALLAFPI